MNRSKFKRKSLNKKYHEKLSIGNILLSLFLLLMIIVLIIISVFYSYIEIAIDSYRVGIDTSKIDYHSIPYMYDINGNEINAYYGYYDKKEDGFTPTYSSKYTKLVEMPEYVYNAFVAIEDETFYENYGFSPKRLLGAIVSYQINGDSSYGGSTITQQLIKIATGDNSHSPERKSRELGAAIYLNEHWEKEQILESYINLAYYGDNSYGIYEASMNYFGKIPKDLNIAEGATLAAMLNKPEGNCPYKSDLAKNALFKRKDIVLDKMLELGFISDEDYNLAKDYNIKFMDKDFEYKDRSTEQYIPLAMKQAKKIVMDYYDLNSDDEAFEMILNGNTKIYTNLDPNLQRKSYEILKNSYLNDIEMGYILTTKDGKVLTAITSKNDSKIDHVYSMTRQTGSSIKPIGVYGPAFDLNLSTPTTVEIDEPVYIDNWKVHNSSNKYHGAVTIKNAIAYSYNTIAVKTLKEVGIHTSMNYLKKLGITSLTKNDLYYPALALGGLSNGISPFEMCQAYNTINNDGLYSNISFISKIEINGTTIFPKRDTKRVFSTEANNMLKECLQAVATYGTAKKIALPNHTIYAKTGTTSNNTDLWTCAFTDEITTTIWAGYDTPKEITVIPSGGLSELLKKLIETYY